jgi:hypothetical protein
MLQGQKLQEAYNDYIFNFSTEKGLEPRTIKNKQHIIGKLLPFLDGRPLTVETCREYAMFMYENGWDKPTSRKILTGIVAFLYERGYITENFSRS